MTSSLKEIAEKLHLSISTVSRAINNTDRISPKTRRLVMDAVRKHSQVQTK
ncbi:MAG: LacI family transcriptional regulator [Lachnospiraceae bacterium]|nr:LacI family transcriptional regulator [Lachnospiraceae bacterium]